jgi:hypothetical protein
MHVKAVSQNFASIAILLSTLAACGGASKSEPPATYQMGGAVQGMPLALRRQVSIASGAVGLPGAIDGPGTAARFRFPWEVTTDGRQLFVTDGGYTIRRIDINSGLVTTIAGADGQSGSTDGTGAAARFFVPRGITTDGARLYVVDSYNHTIRRIVLATGEVTTIAGKAGEYGARDGFGATARFYSPGSITTDGTNLYVTEPYNHTIRKIVIADSEVTTLAGSPGSPGLVDGIGADAKFDTPAGLTTDGANLYVADGSRVVRRVHIASRSVSTLAGSAATSGSDDGIGDSARFAAPFGITTDGTSLYVTDSNRIVRQVELATRRVSTLAGSPTSLGSANGDGAVARFDNPMGIVTNGTSLFIVDSNNQVVRRLD